MAKNARVMNEENQRNGKRPEVVQSIKF
jgi:hypothetical protein